MSSSETRQKTLPDMGAARRRRLVRLPIRQRPDHPRTVSETLLCEGCPELLGAKQPPPVPLDCTRPDCDRLEMLTEVLRIDGVDRRAEPMDTTDTTGSWRATAIEEYAHGAAVESARGPITPATSHADELRRGGSSAHRPQNANGQQDSGFLCEKLPQIMSLISLEVSRTLAVKMQLDEGLGMANGLTAMSPLEKEHA